MGIPLESKDVIYAHDKHTHRRVNTHTQMGSEKRVSQKDHSSKCMHRDSPHLKLTTPSPTHIHTNFLSPFSSLVTEYALCSCSLRERQGAGFLGLWERTWINGLSFIAAMRRAAKHPKHAGDLTSIIKGPFETATATTTTCVKWQLHTNVSEPTCIWRIVLWMNAEKCTTPCYTHTQCSMCQIQQKVSSLY